MTRRVTAGLTTSVQDHRDPLPSGRLPPKILAPQSLTIESPAWSVVLILFILSPLVSLVNRVVVIPPTLSLAAVAEWCNDRYEDDLMHSMEYLQICYRDGGTVHCSCCCDARG